MLCVLGSKRAWTKQVCVGAVGDAIPALQHQQLCVYDAPSLKKFTFVDDVGADGQKH